MGEGRPFHSPFPLFTGGGPPAGHTGLNLCKEGTKTLLTQLNDFSFHLSKDDAGVGGTMPHQPQEKQPGVSTPKRPIDRICGLAEETKEWRRCCKASLRFHGRQRDSSAWSKE